MSVQSNSGSLEGTPSWSQISTSLSQQHITAVVKAKGGKKIILLKQKYLLVRCFVCRFVVGVKNHLEMNCN